MPNISLKKALAGSSPPGGADPLAAVKQITKGESELIKAAIPALEQLRSVTGTANPTAISAIGGMSQYTSILSQITSLISMLDGIAGRKKSTSRANTANTANTVANTSPDGTANTETTEIPTS